jgi:hypothetical protein
MGSMVVKGPISGGRHGWPFAAATRDLTSEGYVEEEFFFSGEAAGIDPSARSARTADGGRTGVRLPEMEATLTCNVGAIEEAGAAGLMGATTPLPVAIATPTSTPTSPRSPRPPRRRWAAACCGAATPTRRSSGPRP